MAFRRANSWTFASDQCPLYGHGGYIRFWPAAAVFVVFYVLRRAGNYAFAQPSRNVLFTTVSREDKYKAKTVIDTVVYRLGDQVGAWSSGLLAWLSFGVSGMAWVAVPLALAWTVNGWWLGRRQEARSAASDLAPA